MVEDFENVFAIYVKGTLICKECATEEECDNFTEFISEADRDEDKFYICDRCKKRI